MLSSNCGHLSRPQCWYEFEIYKFQITIAFSSPWPKKLQNCYYKPYAYYDPLFQISKLSTACPRQCPWSTCDNDYWQQVLYSSTHHGPHTCHQMAPPQPSSARKGQQQYVQQDGSNCHLSPVLTMKQEEWTCINSLRLNDAYILHQ